MSRFKNFITKPWIYIFILVIGISLKFYHIDYRYFWLDEISTVLRTSGLNHEGIDKLAPINEIASLDYYKSLVRLNELDLTLIQQLKGQVFRITLTPLHYFCLTFWHRIFGDSSLALRFFSVFIFLLTLPFIFLLAKKFSGTNLSGWIAISLFSIFSYFQYYSHEARYIMLTVFLIILTSYFLLKALKQKKLCWWLGYIITGTLALYASAILGLLFVAHIIFIILTRKKIFLQFFISICAIFLLYLPWLLNIVFSLGKLEETLRWQELFNDNNNFLFLILMQMKAMAVGLIALEDPYDWFLLKNMQTYSSLIYFLMAIFIIVSVFYAAKRMERKSFYFLLTMVLCSFLFFFISDLIRNAGSSLLYRYHYINFVTALFFIAFFLSHKISRQKIIYFILFTTIAALGVVSIYKASQSKTWYYNPLYDFTPIHYIESSTKCLLISDFTSPFDNDIISFLMVANAIESENVDILRTTPENPEIKTQAGEHIYSDIYIIYASEQLIENLKVQFGERLTQIDDPDLDNPFWQIQL